MGDTNYPPGDFANVDGMTVTSLVLDPPLGGVGFDDIFKCSHVTNSTFNGVTVMAGRQRENAWDANNGTSGNAFRRLVLEPGAECAVLLKDGFSRNTVDDVLILAHGGNSDWYEGDYSDQGGARNTGNIYNNVRMADGSPVRVSWTFFRAQRPVFTHSQVTYQWFLSLARTIYVEAKYFWVSTPFGSPNN